MEISSDLVGAKLKPLKAKVERRASTNYAAAIGETNPIYFDDLEQDNLVSHPVFPVALSWELNSNLDQYIDYPIEKEIIHRLVHQSEHMEIKRLLRVGEEVTIQGKILAVMPHMLGTKIVIYLEYLDINKEIVLKEYTGGIVFGTACADEGKGKDDLPVSPRVELAEGEQYIWSKELFVDRNLPYIYDGCANISAAIHTSPKFATSIGLPDIILHGTASLALAIKELTAHYNIDPRNVTELAAKFTGMVVPGNNITINVLKVEEDNGQKVIDFEVTNVKGEGALKGGRLVG